MQVDQGPKCEKVFLEESGHFLCELMVGKNFLNKRLKHISHKGKIDKLKLKPSLWKKDTINKNEETRQSEISCLWCIRPAKN